jgi:hypothetical protein
MVKTAKPDTIINTINKSISDNITNSIQSSQNSVYQAQIVNILCDIDAINIVENGINTCRSTLKDKGVSNDLINKYCISILNCKGSNISLNSSLNVTNITSQTAVITQTVKDTITSDIKQKLNSIDNQLKALLAETQADIENINTQVQENIVNIVQKIQNNVTQNQNITLTNYSANNITITSVNDIVFNSVQNISSIQSIVQNISNKIVQVLNNKPKTLADMVLNIASIVLAFIIVIFVIVGVLKSNDNRNFLNKYSPYIIFIIISVLIIWLHLILKPSYILKNNNNFTIIIDNNKLILYCSTYIIILGVIEIIIYKFKK